MTVSNINCPLIDIKDHKYLGFKGKDSNLKIQKFTGIDSLESVRTTTINGNPYLAYNDVCKSLNKDNSNFHRFKKELDDREEVLRERNIEHNQYYMYINTECRQREYSGGRQDDDDNNTQYKEYSGRQVNEEQHNTQYKDTLFISESAFNIMAYRSKDPDAIQYTNWVTDKVIPSIRQISEGFDTTGDKVVDVIKDVAERGINFLNENENKRIDRLESDIVELKEQLSMINNNTYNVVNNQCNDLRNRINSIGITGENTNVRLTNTENLVCNIAEKTDTLTDMTNFIGNAIDRINR
jgi:prophage antirepressor-like protein